MPFRSTSRGSLQSSWPWQAELQVVHGVTGGNVTVPLNGNHMATSGQKGRVKSVFKENTHQLCQFTREIVESESMQKAMHS